MHDLRRCKVERRIAHEQKHELLGRCVSVAHKVVLLVIPGLVVAVVCWCC